MRPLSSVKPNPWNPNRMSAFERESLAQGLREDGWLKAQSLLVWGTDQKGKRRDVIIDGEQRWTVAPSVGFSEGPMVYLDGLNEKAAKALTLKFMYKKGKADELALASVIRDLELEDFDLAALDLGIGHEELLRLSKFDPEILDGGAGNEAEGGGGMGSVTSENPHVKVVPLYFDPKEHESFEVMVRKLGAQHGTETVTDTVVAVFKAALA